MKLLMVDMEEEGGGPDLGREMKDWIYIKASTS